MKRLIYVLLTVVLFTVALIGCSATQNTANPGTKDVGSSTQSTQKKPLVIATDASYAPMESMKDGKIVGFDVDFANALGKQMNREVKIENVPWDNIFDELYAGKYDAVISSVSITDERKASMLFSDPYFISAPTILTRKSLNVQSAKDLSGKNVAVQDGTTAQDVISKNVPGVKLKTFGDAVSALASFEKGEADAVVLDRPVILDYAKQKNNPDYQIVGDDSIFSQEQYGIAVNKGNDTLLSEINKALAALKSNGEYSNIYSKFF